MSDMRVQDAARPPENARPQDAARRNGGDARPQQPTRFGSRIRERRMELGLRVEELAARAGISWRYLRNLEQGERGEPTWGRALRLAAALGLDPATLEPTRDAADVRREYQEIRGESRREAEAVA